MTRSTAPPPRLPDRYRLWPDAARGLVGRGGAGEVWRAHDQVLGVLVALKVLRSEGSRDRSRLLREAALAAQVVHPNVVALHDVGETLDGEPFLAFALASDGSLLDTAANPPPWSELVGLLADLLRALAALHARGTLHLDVKLSNLLLHRASARGRVLWLADLGIARQFNIEQEEDSVVLGTVSYMASERLMGQRHLWGPSTDLFSVGAIAWRLVTGSLPFPERDPAQALSARRRPPTALSPRPGYRVPAGLDEVLLPMLAYDRRARFDEASDALRALQSLPPAMPEDAPAARPHNPAGRPEATPPGVLPWNRPAPRAPPRSRPRAHLPRRAPLAPTLLPHREIPLIGREEEMEALWRAVRGVVRARQPLLVHITGPRGVGRTRLVQELTRSLAQEGLGEGVVLEYAVREGPAYGLLGAWRRLAPLEQDTASHTDQIAQTFARDRQAPLTEVIDEARALHGWMAPSEEAAAADRSVVKTLLVDHLALRSWRGLSWLWLEDLHLATPDDDAWALIDLILARKAPILILATTRAEARPARLRAATQRHARSVRTLTLKPLDAAQSNTLVDALLPLDPALTRELAAHTNGNPRYIRDLLLHWIRRGALATSTPTSGEAPCWTRAAGAPPLPANRHAFAWDLLEHALQQEPDLLLPLLTVALAGRGTPDRVLARVIDDGLDRLIIAGLLTLERNLPVLVPPELPSAIRAWPRPPALDERMHAALAAAWAEEGQDAAVLYRVGTHRAEAGDLAGALEPLDLALRALRRSLPVPDVIRLARRVRGVAEAAPPPAGSGSPPWARAVMALSDALWHHGQGEAARELDERLERLALPPEDAVRAACVHALHLDRDAAQVGMARLARVSQLLGAVPPNIQAEYFCTRGRCRNRLLDDDGALEDFGAVLALKPDPITETTSRYYRSLLLSNRNRTESFREAMRCLDLARAHGLLQWEAMAWGAAGEQLVVLGRTDEAVTHLKRGIARLEAHGEQIGAAELRNALGEVLRRAERDEEARATYRAVVENTAFSGVDVQGVARANLALMDALDRRGDAVLGWYRGAGRVRDDPTMGSAWAILVPIGQLLAGQPSVLPDDESISRAARLGPDGVFLDLALATLLAESGMPEDARHVERRVQETCERFQVDPDPAEPMLARFRAKR